LVLVLHYSLEEGTRNGQREERNESRGQKKWQPLSGCHKKFDKLKKKSLTKR